MVYRLVGKGARLGARLPTPSSPCGPMAAAFTDRWVMAAWVGSVEELKAGIFQLVGTRHFCTGLNTSTPLSSPSVLWRTWRRLAAKGPRESAKGGALGSQGAPMEPQ